MSSPVIEVLVICSKSKRKFNPLGSIIQKEIGLGFSHFSIAVLYDGQAVISEASWPRPRFVSLEEWLKLNEPVFVFRKEVKNQALMFKMMSWMSIVCTKSYYSISQLLLIYLAIKIPSLKNWSETVKLNHENGLICSEYLIEFMEEFFAFEIKKSPDSIGLKEPFEALTASWVLLDDSQINTVVRFYAETRT